MMKDRRMALVGFMMHKAYAWRNTSLEVIWNIELSLLSSDEFGGSKESRSFGVT